ncbi:sulfatase family protein [Ilumatobacter coccineus]|uniref:Putative sulfatase n=1 Tax=Ilumatobacter coccineus (strain NBRC 103263 / KCTC 29153 / YM16-304) TaxID=1313172 RepID=A0A6C7E3M9_ILUCY|nr:sulfatase [Ilumatobacter coccineus]BAN00912.1 putative sulfatase [Ilumatobacter coccineus YM16-304]
MTNQPNVVLINCDDLGYGDLGCYGSTLNKTPAIDGLAADGLRFDSFYTASPVCSPARGALLTGCYPPRIGFGRFEGVSVLFPGMGLGLAPEEYSLASLLSDAGYRTQAVGKWHCGDQPDFQPTNHGFDHYFGLPYSNDMGIQAGGEPPTMPELAPLPLIADGQVIEQQPDLAALTGRYVDEALKFMRVSDERPFFLYLAHMYVHLPIYVEERFAEQSSNGVYGAAVESIDWATAVILAELEAQGIVDDTIVIFTSDNGSLGDNPPPWGEGESLGASNGALRGAKTTTWEGGQRVPGIVRWPARVEAGRVSGELVTAMDLYPTLAALCGGRVPTDRIIDGRDIQSIWFGDAPSPHEVFYYYWMNDLEAVRSGRWKLHFSKHGAEQRELYDLDSDIGETTNVLADVLADRPDVVERLDRLAEVARSTLGDERLGRSGSEVRPVGEVDDPAPLTRYDPDHPYIVAEYDITARG